MVELPIAELHGSLGDPVLASMAFLNDIAHRYPDAVSFAAGRPYDGFFHMGDLHRYLRTYADHRSALDSSDEPVRRTLFQYGPTKGVINELIAWNLSVDEGFEPAPENIVVTTGCQEALFLVVRALRRDDRDVLLAVTPTYVGLTGAARLVDMPVHPVRDGPAGIDLDDLVGRIRAARANGLRPRACYLVPDFANPMGASLSEDTRRELVEIAAREEVLLLEDNPYGLYNLQGRRPSTLKALDETRCVVYLGTYAKTALPGARVGFVVADQPVIRDAAHVGTLADELSNIKSMVTLNTSPVAQALVAGKLLENGGSLLAANRREIQRYTGNLNYLLDGLAARFRGGEGVSWNMPGGGFFVVLTVPFPADDAALVESAEGHGVLWTPMSHFYAGTGGDQQLRLSHSALTHEQIDTGLDRLAAFVRSR